MKEVSFAAVSSVLKTQTLQILDLPNVTAVGSGLDDRGYYLSINTSGSTKISLPEELNKVRVVVARTDLV